MCMFIKSVRYMAQYKKALKNKESKLLWRYIFHSVRNISRQIKTTKSLLTLQELKCHALISEVESERNEARNSCLFKNTTHKKIRIYELLRVYV